MTDIRVGAPVRVRRELRAASTALLADQVNKNPTKLNFATHFVRNFAYANCHAPFGQKTADAVAIFAVFRFVSAYSY